MDSADDAPDATLDGTCADADGACTLRAAIQEAKEAYTSECRRAGIVDLPEFLITEWSHGGRGTPFAPAVFADVMTALYEATLDLHSTPQIDDALVAAATHACSMIDAEFADERPTWRTASISARPSRRRRLM